LRGREINKSILNIWDEKINIPLHGKLSSLNVSVAAGIFLFRI
jgi:rRNA methylases